MDWSRSILVFRCWGKLLWWENFIFCLASFQRPSLELGTGNFQRWVDCIETNVTYVVLFWLTFFIFLFFGLKVKPCWNLCFFFFTSLFIFLRLWSDSFFSCFCVTTPVLLQQWLVKNDVFLLSSWRLFKPSRNNITIGMCMATTSRWNKHKKPLSYIPKKIYRH